MPKTDYPVRIRGMGRYLPERVVTNAEVEELCGVRPGSFSRTEAGVETRRWAAPGENCTMMAAHAARQAVSNAEIEFEEIDLFLNASGTQQQAIPDGAPFLQAELGLGKSGVACMSVHTTCLGFLNALDVAGAFLQTGRYQRILVFNSDVASVGLNFAEPSSAALFGDAAAAAVLEASDASDGATSRIDAVRFETYGDAAHLTEVRGGGTKQHPNMASTVPEDNLFHMDGAGVFAFAAKRFLRFVQTFNEEVGEDVFQAADWVVPHQPSMKAIRLLERVGIPRERIVVNLDTLGNCISTSIPSALYEGISDGRIQRGDRVLMVGSGAGLSLGAVLLRY